MQRRTWLVLLMIGVLAALAYGQMGPSDPAPERLVHEEPWPAWVRETIVGTLALAMGLAFWLLFRPRWDFVITVEDGEVIFGGDFPAHRRWAVEQFLREDLAVSGNYRILGRWEDQRLSITIRGASAEPYLQQIRNYLNLTLRR